MPCQSHNSSNALPLRCTKFLMRCFRLVQQSLESDHSLFGLTVTAINYVDRARCLERRYRRSRDTIDRLAWIGQLRALHHLYRQKEAAYWEDLVTKNSANPKRLWSTISGLLEKSSSTSPSDDYQRMLSAKLDKLRAALATSPPPTFC